LNLNHVNEFNHFLLFCSTVKAQTEKVQVKYEKLLAMVKSPDLNSDFKESRKGMRFAELILEIEFE